MGNFFASVDNPKPIIVDDAVRFHNELARKWEEKYNKDSFAERQRVLSECLHDIGLVATTWLDAGCGTGTLSRLLARKGCTVEAVDGAPEMVSVARTLHHQVSGSLRIDYRVVSTIEKLPFSDNYFDGILCSSVLEYVRNPAACLVEFRRVLKSQGTLLVSVPSAYSIVRMFLKLAYRCTAALGRPWPEYFSISTHEYSAGGFTKLLLSQGFQADKVVCFGMLGHSLLRNPFLNSLLMFRATKP